MSRIVIPPFEIKLDAPQDDGEARGEVSNRPELRSVKEVYNDTISGRLKLLKREQVEKTFGPELEKEPDDKILPLFIPVDLTLYPFFGNVVEDGTWNKSFTGFHALGDNGYLKIFYEISNTNVEDLVLYLRQDDTFVPLKSTNDFSRRVEWEKSKVALLNQWLDQRIPSTDLGVVEVSTNLVHVDFGDGKTGLILASVFPKMSETNISYGVLLTTQSWNIIAVKNFDRTNQVAWFSIQGNFYRMTPKLVGPILRTNN